MHWGDYGWVMGFGGIFMVLFWVMVILGVVYLIQLITKGKSTEKEDRAD